MILFKYILKNHVGPFFFAVFTLFAVFLLQFLMKFADRLIGKGLSLVVIVKLIVYNLAWMVVLVIPMSILVATLMAFGSMAQNNEIAIMKASGVSLYKMMLTPILVSIIIGYLLIQFNNHVYPDANHAARLLMEDISRKKPTLSLVPGVFSQEIPSYSILVRDVNQQQNEIKDITIYDFSSQSKTNIVTAKYGKIYFIPSQKKIIMDLYNGEIHQSDNFYPENYKRLKFIRDKIALPADQFTFEQSTPGGPRYDRELGAHDMLILVDSLNSIKQRRLTELKKAINEMLENKLSNNNSNKINIEKYSLAFQNLQADKNRINSMLNNIEYLNRQMDSYWVEIHKKYSIPFACIVFVLIGAPIGTMIRKGGFGIASGISLIFFLIYWAFLIGGEKLADRDLLSPFWGMWSANVVFLLFGIYLTIKTARERVELNFNFLTKLVPKNWRFAQNEIENS
ncbi:LptF/LptG family permease [Melioribacteraceae bacterium 4301-Me]|uniref:LptF/LptG family permease n=1 Tax=Pyranulibacter aquaticus TaxID=3163344 RepID=UPI003595A50A